MNYNTRIVKYLTVALTVFALTANSYLYSQKNSKNYQEMPYTEIKITVDPANWGVTNWAETKKTLESVITYYDSVMMFNNRRPIKIINSQSRSPPIDYPMTINGDSSTAIFLAGTNNSQSRFLYQWSHEVIHYLLKREYRPNRDKFAWFIESICELSSIYYMSQYRHTGVFRQPIESDYWQLAHIKYGLDQITKVTFVEEFKLSEYIAKNLNYLEADCELRNKNRVIAVSMLPYFIQNPNLWRFISELSKIPYEDSVSFKEYLRKWLDMISPRDRVEFTPLYNLLSEGLP